MAVVSRLYGAEFDFPRRDGEPDITYTIATIPRTGSSHFAIQLWRTGVLGAPMEYINLKGVDALTNRLGCDDILRYWRDVLALRTGPNGVFGYKSFVANLRGISYGHPKLLPLLAPQHVVYLTRADKCAQAVSYSRAIRSRSWFADAKGQQTPDYDFDDIAHCERMIERQEEDWEKIFRLTEVEPLRIEYGALHADPEAVIARVARFVGVELDLKARLDIPGIAVQSDSMSREWIERYREERAARPPAVASSNAPAEQPMHA